MSQFSQEQLDYFYGFPAWAVAAWATPATLTPGPLEPGCFTIPARRHPTTLS